MFLCVSEMWSRLEAPTAEISCGGRRLGRFPSTNIHGLHIWWTLNRSNCGTNNIRQIWYCQAVERATMVVLFCELASVVVDGELDQRGNYMHCTVARLQPLAQYDLVLIQPSTTSHLPSELAGAARVRRTRPTWL